MTHASNDQQRNLLHRLARIEGQLRGIQKLINQQADCEKILQQMSAARRAFDKAQHEMLACMIEQEITSIADPTNKLDLAPIKQLLSKYG